jgi:hypothetical protein
VGGWGDRVERGGKEGLEKGAVRGDELDEDEGGRAEDWRRRGTRSRGGGDDG